MHINFLKDIIIVRIEWLPILIVMLSLSIPSKLVFASFSKVIFSFSSLFAHVVHFREDTYICA